MACVFAAPSMQAATTDYYWKDAAGNGRWDWGGNQWGVANNPDTGVPQSDGGAIINFEGIGSTDTYVNSHFPSGYFLLNSVILNSNSSGRAYTINVENGGSGVDFFNKIETQSGSGSLAINTISALGGDAATNAFGGTITLGQVQTNGKTWTVDGTSGISVGDVVNGTGTGSVQKNGGNTLALSGSSDNLNVTLAVNAGIVLLNKTSGTSVHAVGAGLTVNSGGTVILGNNSGDQIYSGSFVSINSGGTLKTNGNSEGSGSVGSAAGVGALTLQGGATIDFGAGPNGSTLSASSGVISGSGLITILNWTGLSGIDDNSGTNDRLLYQSDPGFNAAQLSQFRFYDDGGNAIGSGAVEIAFNGWMEIVPVPESATWVGGVMAVVGIAVFSRKQRIVRRK